MSKKKNTNNSEHLEDEFELEFRPQEQIPVEELNKANALQEMEKFVREATEALQKAKNIAANHNLTFKFDFHEAIKLTYTGKYKSVSAEGYLIDDIQEDAKSQYWDSSNC